MKSIYLCAALGMIFSGAVAGTPMQAHAQTATRSEVKIRLTGVVLNGLLTQGNARYRVDGAKRGFQVEASAIRLADGTLLSVQVNGVAVGVLSLLAGRGAVELSTERRQAVPAIKAGDVVRVVAANGAVLLAGKF